jgi:histidinol-phosphatase (PHP family)
VTGTGQRQPLAAISASEPGLGKASDLPLDSHLHSDLSSDSIVPIDAYAEQAVERRIAELAITDHLDFDPRAPNAAFRSYGERERRVREAAERWDGRVAIRFGVEISYESAREDEIRDHLARHAYDFVIGSVHVHSFSPWHAPHVDATMRGRTLAEAIAPYFEEVEAAARSGLFDTIGHLDYVKKYLVRHVPPTSFVALDRLYEPALLAIAGNGIGLEVNTSGLRHAVGETYPGPWAVERFRQLGGDRVTIGSDAHAHDHFTFGLERAYRIAADAGFEKIAFRRGPLPVTVDIPHRFSTAG